VTELLTAHRTYLLSR